jgi:cellulose synthase/poly-beta-1,6-N-acetylglucosamine synthase-like glycosyltransferase
MRSSSAESMELPLNVTVAIILHGDPPDIQRTISSVRSQDYALGRVSILCLDDGTSPTARTVLDELGVWTVDLPSHSSISTAKNKVLELSSDEFVFFLDDHIYLEPGGLHAGMEAFLEQPDLAGVCGYYRSPKTTDWNTLRDIKRHSIYGKSTERRLITLDAFTTFSTGIGIVRKSIFERLDFPEETFPPDYGGEDIPALLTALNQGHCFAYVPDLVGWHEHNLNFTEFLHKIEIEVRGRFSVFYWASGANGFEIPYLHGFLNFPIFLSVSLFLACVASWFGWTGLFVAPALFMAVEVLHSLRCFSTPIDYPFRDRVLAACYVLASDLLTPVCALQYTLSDYKRPYARLGLRRAFALTMIFLHWEFAKLGFPRRRVSTVSSANEAPHLPERAQEAL